MTQGRTGCVRVPAMTLQYLRILKRGHALIVLLYLIDTHGYDTWGEYGVRAISRELSIGINSAREAMEVLTDLGFVEVSKGDNQHSPGRIRIPSPLCGACNIDCSKQEVAVSESDTAEVVYPKQIQQFDFNFLEEAQVNDGDVSETDTAPEAKGTLLGLKVLGLGVGESEGKGKDDSVQVIFDAWQNAGVVKHRAMLVSHEKAIRATVKRIKKSHGDDAVPEIVRSIENFGFVLNSPVHRWTYRWTLDEFLSRGVERFMDEANPRERFAGNASGGSKATTKTFSHGRSLDAYDSL